MQKTTSTPTENRPDKIIVASVRGLKKSFGERKVLRGVTMDLYAGENLVILGRSGTGKSVLIKCMVGLIDADEGDMNILGFDVPTIDSEELNKMRLQIGFSFQSSALYDSMSVRENLEFPLKRILKIYDQQKLNTMVTLALQEVGLESAIDLFPAELSGGMKKRIGIARTLILKPTIMLYDEPTAGLDPITSAEINKLILEVQKKYKTSSIIITHDISCARETSDRVIALIEGRNEAEGTFDELRQMKNVDLEPFFNY